MTIMQRKLETDLNLGYKLPSSFLLLHYLNSTKIFIEYLLYSHCCAKVFTLIDLQLLTISLVYY